MPNLLVVLNDLPNRNDLAQLVAAGADCYRVIAAEVLMIPPEQVSRQQRAEIKNALFGFVYGSCKNDPLNAFFALIRQARKQRGSMFKKG